MKKVILYVITFFVVQVEKLCYRGREVSLIFDVSFIKLVVVSVVRIGTSFLIPASGSVMVVLSVVSVVEVPELQAKAIAIRQMEKIFFIIII